MINRIHAYFHDPARGWDPISEGYARGYGANQVADLSLVDRFDRSLGGLVGKKIIDVASGPGHYSIEFARRGAVVTCFDISRNYLAMARDRFDRAGFVAEYALGYLDDINAVTSGNFDGVFSNIAWNYCMNDFTFARALVNAVRPGGKIFIRETNETFERDKGVVRKALYALNRSLGLKIGHVHPPRGRVEQAFERAGCALEAIYPDPATDIVIATRSL
jgi:2-polyprenyl-3-methyl-5-hydroxy-6-metoxy-1,4-benzoquinol methylase